MSAPEWRGDAQARRSGVMRIDWMRRFRFGFRAGWTLALVGALLGASRALATDAGATLRVAFAIAETSFDPQFASDAASDAVIDNVFDAMLDYDPLVRPPRLVPRTLVALPEVRDGGSTYLCRIRPGIRFAPDPAFGGRERELTAADHAYGLKRLLDPAVRSPWAWLIESRILGAEAARGQATKTGRFDYDAPLPGIEVVDRYTLRLKLVAPDLRFPYVLAVPNTAAVAREVVERYGVDLGAHPVGTGPYRLAEYQRSSRIVLEANPLYRKATYVPAGPLSVEMQPLATALAGKPLPRNGRIEISIIEEAQSRWLAFMRGELDVLENVPVDFIDEVLDQGRLKPSLAAKGIRHEPLLRPNVYFAYFNMDDPVVGGYAPEKIALRRAVAMGYDVQESIRVLQKGRAVPAESPIPADVAGRNPAFSGGAQRYDPALSRALLDRFGYRDRDGDGYRELPDGRPLSLERWSTPASSQRQADELWKKNMDAIGIRVVFRKDKLPELRKMARAGQIPFRSDGWNVDYPDAENFMQLLYGPNAGQENAARFRLPEFDRLYDAARQLPDGPERTRLFDRMSELVIAYAPWRLTFHIVEDHLAQRWVATYKPHPIKTQTWRYIEVDPARLPR
jgi:ABC-type transport system substrate-binding protein